MVRKSALMLVLIGLAAAIPHKVNAGVATTNEIGPPNGYGYPQRCTRGTGGEVVSDVIPSSEFPPVAMQLRGNDGVLADWDAGGIAWQVIAPYAELIKNHEALYLEMSRSGSLVCWAMPIRVCDSSTCRDRVVTARLALNKEGSLLRTFEFFIGDDFDRKPVTVSVPIDGADPNNGYSKPSNPITGFLNQRDAIRQTLGKQAIDFDYGFLASIGISNVGACFNETVDTPIVEDVDDPERESRFGWGLDTRLLNNGRYYIDLRNYRTATYTLREDGSVVESGPIKSGFGEQWWMKDGGLCALKGDSYMGNPRAPFAPMNFPEPQEGRNHQISAGHVYRLTYSLSGESVPELSGSLDFVTPGGCPSSDALASIPTDPNFVNVPPADYAILDENQNFLARLPRGTNDYLARYTLAPAVLAGRLAPMYQTWTKAYLGTSSGTSWQYVPSIDDWASVVASAQPMTYSKVLERTIFSGCAPSQVSIIISPEPTEGEPAACETVENLVVPKYTGMCVLKVTVRRASTIKAGVRKQSAPVALRVPFSFSSLGRFTVPRSTPTLSVKVSQSVTAASLAKTAKLTVPRTSKTSLKVAPSSAKYCRLYKSTVKTLKAGTCRVTVTVTPRRGKATSKTVNIKISK